MPANQAASAAASSGSVLYDSADRGRQRQVHDPDARLVPVVHHELEAVDDVEDGGVAAVVGDLDRDDVRLGRDAHVARRQRVAAVADAVAGDQACHVRAVAHVVVGVVAHGLVTAEAITRDWPADMKSGCSRPRRVRRPPRRRRCRTRRASSLVGADRRLERLCHARRSRLCGFGTRETELPFSLRRPLVQATWGQRPPPLVALSPPRSLFCVTAWRRPAGRPARRPPPRSASRRSR